MSDERTWSTRFDGVYSEEEARKINKESGEIWFFIARGLKVWYEGVNPDESWCWSDGDYQGDVFWSQSFRVDAKLQSIDGIQIGSRKFISVVLLEDRPRDHELGDMDVHHGDSGKRGYVFTTDGMVPCELVDVTWLAPGDECMKYEWLDEITLLMCIRPEWRE